MYSYHSILECYSLFSGVKLSTRSFCFYFVHHCQVGELLLFPWVMVCLITSGVIHE